MSTIPPGPYGPATLRDLAQIVHLVTGVAPESVRPESAFVADLKVDSLAMVEILAGAEAHFGRRIDDAAVRDFRQVQDLVGYLSRA